MCMMSCFRMFSVLVTLSRSNNPNMDQWNQWNQQKGCFSTYEPLHLAHDLPIIGGHSLPPDSIDSNLFFLPSKCIHLLKSFVHRIVFRSHISPQLSCFQTCH